MKRAAIIASLLFAAYVGSYGVLSRIGIAQAASQGSEFYFLIEPTTPFREQCHYRMIELYWPLIQVERWAGADHAPAACGNLQLS
ncbi:hypothetical protein [Blastopirellula marina]|uniref:Uncharacterized protein n=1 Tax=Blastopirellula marina TaxID=124 RepID=A0A2S8GP18_9BACT|nr:hypothetical protein [Blastopirellula marina]PQO46167.1 hypothetical protein C5Y93_09255 [Blastopirellula marina]